MKLTILPTREKGKKMQATKQILLSFLFVILVGTFFLSLPISNVEASAGFLNNLFIATSATCVTGLTPLVVIEQYTIFGQFVILCMIQIGGLGFMTILALFLVGLGQKLSFSDRNMVQEALNLNSQQNMANVLKRILMYTFVIEGIGAILLSLVFIPDYGFLHGGFVAFFTSVSAFCNAGFDLIGAVSLAPYALNPVLNFTIMSLIIVGGIGFVVWFEFAKKLPKLFQDGFSIKRFFKALNLHTKLVIVVTAFLLVFGAVLIFAIEHDNMQTIGSFSLADQWMVSFFQSTTLRTAGFSTINMGLLRPATQFMMLPLMFIGGSPGGTAGGVKTTSFMILLLAIWAQMKGKTHATIFHKELERELMIRSLTIVGISLCLLFACIFVTLLVEPHTFMELTFETVSALATVGLSLNLTPILSSVGKIVIIILMYAGRVGVMSLGVSLIKRTSSVKNEITYPKENVLI